MVNLLLVTDHFLPSWGGIERYAFNLARLAMAKGVNVTILTEWKNSLADCTPNIKKHLEKVRIIRKFKMHQQEAFLPTSFLLESKEIEKEVKAELNRNHYDILHYSGYHIPSFKSITKRIPKIMSVHGIFPACAHSLLEFCGEPSGIKCSFCSISKVKKRNMFFGGFLPILYSQYYKLVRKSLVDFNKIICVSNFVEAVIRNVFSDLGSLTTIHNFVDIENEILPSLDNGKLVNMRRSLDLNDNSSVIFYCGRPTFRKGLPLLLDAFKKINRKDTYLVIAGGTMSQIKRFVFNQERIILAGFLPRSTLLQFMKQSNVFVHPPTYPDACPTVLLEALSLGTPIIATNVGGIPEIVENNRNGYLSETHPDVLSKKIGQILDDNEFTTICKQENPIKAKEFDIQLIGKRVMSLYNDSLY